MKSRMVREMMNMLRSIAGWGVVPRMAPPPSQGGSTLRGREREREIDEKRDREKCSYIHSFIPHKGLNSTRGGSYKGV